MILFGNSSGPVPPFDPLVLASKGSLFLTRPGLNKYSATRDEILMRTADMFRWVETGTLKLRIDSVRTLADLPQAFRDLESRKTTGKVLFHVEAS
jgi:NADPH:quinone reductase